ncbi:MAG: YkgJ family cysteine cluster protein [Polyangiaceae bacterium]
MKLSPIKGAPSPDGADCVSCGRCCHHGPNTVHFLESDEARVLEHPQGEEILRRLTLLDPRPPWFRFVQNGGDHCGALDVSVDGRYPCSIYEVRPDDCRIVEPGSPSCLEARRTGRLGTSVEFSRSDPTPPTR